MSLCSTIQFSSLIEFMFVKASIKKFFPSPVFYLNTNFLFNGKIQNNNFTHGATIMYNGVDNNSRIQIQNKKKLKIN